MDTQICPNCGYNQDNPPEAYCEDCAWPLQAMTQQQIQSLVAAGEANYAKQPHDEYDLSFIESFSQWLDAKGDALAAPDSFESWLKEREDQI